MKKNKLKTYVYFNKINQKPMVVARGGIAKSVTQLCAKVIIGT